MLEHSIYSVISPEGCASILWKDAEKMREAAEALRLTAQDLLKLGVAAGCDRWPLNPIRMGLLRVRRQCCPEPIHCSRFPRQSGKAPIPAINWHVVQTHGF
jgi:hypothetical protein